MQRRHFLQGTAAAAVAALTVYDMVKGVDRGAEIRAQIGRAHV